MKLGDRNNEPTSVSYNYKLLRCAYNCNEALLLADAKSPHFARGLLLLHKYYFTGRSVGYFLDSARRKCEGNQKFVLIPKIRCFFNSDLFLNNISI